MPILVKTENSKEKITNNCWNIWKINYLNGLLTFGLQLTLEAFF